MFVPNMSRACLVSVCITSITGCGVSAYTHRDTNPVVIDDTNNNNFWGNTLDSVSFTTFSTTASRRMVVVLQDRNITQICSEPSPDVGEAFASAVADAINVKAPIEAVPVELSNQYARAVSTQIASLIYRTQGLQLYRDAMHNLCVDKLNKWISIGGETNAGTYEALRKYYFDQSLELIKAELKSIKEVGTVKAGDKPDVDKVVKSAVDLLKAVKPEPAAVAKPIQVE